MPTFLPDSFRKFPGQRRLEFTEDDLALATYDNHHNIFYFSSSSSPPHSHSRPPSLGPTRTSRSDRRPNSITSNSHVQSTSSPQRPHAIIIPGRAPPTTMGGFFVPEQPEYSLPTPDSLSHSFGPFHAYNNNNPPTPSYPPQHPSYATPTMSISPTDLSTLSILQSSPPLPPPKGKHTDGDGLSEKRRKRRESHNAVERRRRDNINERIGELAGLIPGVLFECDAPLIPPTSPTCLTATSLNESVDLFSLPLLPDAGTPEDPLPDPNAFKKDPSEDADDARAINTSTNPNGGIPTNGISIANGSEPQMIKANKGMILRKSVEYIRYLQQLINVQASRGRDLEEQNRALERELAAFRGQGTTIGIGNTNTMGTSGNRTGSSRSNSNSNSHSHSGLSIPPSLESSFVESESSTSASASASAGLSVGSPQSCSLSHAQQSQSQAQAQGHTQSQSQSHRHSSLWVAERKWEMDVEELELGLSLDLDLVETGPGTGGGGGGGEEEYGRGRPRVRVKGWEGSVEDHHHHSDVYHGTRELDMEI